MDDTNKANRGGVLSARKVEYHISWAQSFETELSSIK